MNLAHPNGREKFERWKMRRTLLIATLIFATCAAAPAQTLRMKADTMTGAVGGAANGVGQTVSGLRITQSTSADASGGSTLSLTGGNLKLEKNTTFHLVLNQSTGVHNYDRN
jgi:hypothetical protein